MKKIPPVLPLSRSPTLPLSHPRSPALRSPALRASVANFNGNFFGYSNPLTVLHIASPN
jgi:hypothetical protein